MQHTPGNCCSDKKGKYRKNVGRRKGKEENLPIWDVYETTGNETLQDISEGFGVSVQTLIQANTHLGKLSFDSVFELHSELWIRPQEENISLQKEPSMTWMNQSRNNNHNTNVNSSVSRTVRHFLYMWCVTLKLIITPQLFAHIFDFKIHVLYVFKNIFKNHAQAVRSLRT